MKTTFGIVGASIRPEWHLFIVLLALVVFGLIFSILFSIGNTKENPILTWIGQWLMQDLRERIGFKAWLIIVVVLVLIVFKVGLDLMLTALGR